MKKIVTAVLFKHGLEWCVYPFDFVRKSQNLKFRHSLSTVPYSATFFGVYFLNRNPHDLKNQCKWALFSSFLASLAEIPFDKAKLKMMGDRRTMIFANGLYVPFSSMMLVMYDKAMQRIFADSKKNETEEFKSKKLGYRNS